MTYLGEDKNQIYYLKEPFVGSPEQIQNRTAMNELGGLTANPTYRNIQGNPVGEFTQGQISLAEAIQRITSSVPYNPSAGPQINTGVGNVPLTNIQQNSQLGAGFTAQAGGQPIQIQGQGQPQAPVQQPQQQPIQPPRAPQQPLQAPQTAQKPQQAILPQPISSYSGVSIVDYLNSTGQASDFASRQRLAQQQGIQNYTGSSEQNTQLLSLLRGQQPSAPIIKLPEPILNADNPQAVDDILKKTGLGTTTTAIDTDNLSITDVIKNVADVFGLNELTKEMKGLDDQMAEDIAFVNENPWISEGLRSKKVAAIQGKYENRKDALVDRLRLNQDAVGQAIDIYYKERELKQQLLLKGLEKKNEMLTPATIQSTINQITSNFDNEQIVKNFSTSAAGFQTMANIKNNTNNPADDIAMIYQFAKIMDPNSVVREGEYAVVQRYAQSWAQSFGFNAARIFSNTKFLTAQAIQNMKAAANAKFQADKGAYTNLANEYTRRIEEAKQGQIGGSISNYAAGYNVAQSADNISTQNDETNQNIQPDNVPIGGTYSNGGILYLRTGADEFEPIGNVKQ